MVQVSSPRVQECFEDFPSSTENRKVFRNITSPSQYARYFQLDRGPWYKLTLGVEVDGVFKRKTRQLTSYLLCFSPALSRGCWLGTNRHIKFILNLNQWLGPEKLLGASSHWIYEMVFSKMCITTKYYRGKISIFKFELLMPAADAGNWCPPVSKCRWISGSLSLSLSASVTTRSPLVLVHNPRNVSMVIPCHCLLTAHQGRFYFI